jgi:hypothetical protein
VAFERAEGFALGFAFADAPVEVGACFGLVFGPDDRDCVDRVVRLAVATAVEAVSNRLAGGRRDGAVPLQRAKAASCVKRLGLQASSFAAEIGPMPGSSSSIFE